MTTPLMPQTSDASHSPPKDDEQQESSMYANRHIPRFLQHQNNGTTTASPLQVVTDGSKLTASNLQNDSCALHLHNPILVTDTAASIGMTVPTSKKKEEFTVRDVMNVVGSHYPISVIDVAHQEELEGWTMEDLVEYFEDRSNSRMMEQPPTTTTTNRPKRRAAQVVTMKQNNNRPKVLNQISMEFSRTPLQRLVKSPKFVRDMDWIDHAWPRDWRNRGDYPVVQYYCLTSTAGCYTDFHIDFGGTAVWYHVLNGQKQFVLVAPTDENLQKYEEWLCHAQQAQLYFPDMIGNKDDIVKITLEASQTLVIPTGWIHGVYTPMDSVVIGGNFLHGLDMELQLKVYCVETRARVQERFRFPFFCPIMYFAGAWYLNKLKQQQQVCKREMEGLPHLIKALKEWWKMHSKQAMGGSGVNAFSAAEHAAKMADCVSVEDMLDSLESRYEMNLNNKPTLKKLTIKLTSPEAKPKLRLKLGSSSTKSEESKNEDDDEFKIVVPHSSKFALASKKRKSITKDNVDAGSILDKNDGEWRPGGGSSSKKKRPSIGISASISPPRTQSGVDDAKKRPSMFRLSPGGSKAATRRVSATSTKKKTTSRQRLMRRIR